MFLPTPASPLNIVTCLAVVIQAVIAETQSYCKTVDINNVKYQKTRRGQYDLLDSALWCGPDRPSYRQTGGQNYLYHMNIQDGWSGWMVGSLNCINKGGIAAASNVKRPEDVPQGLWEEVYGSTWYRSSDLHVACKSGLSVGASVGIVFAAIIIIGAVLLAFVLCCCKKSAKNRRSVRDNSTSLSSSRRSPSNVPAQRSLRTRLHTVSNSVSHPNAVNSSGAIDHHYNPSSDIVRIAKPPPYEAEYTEGAPPPYSAVDLPDVHGQSGHYNRGHGQMQHVHEEINHRVINTPPPPYDQSSVARPNAASDPSNNYVNRAFEESEE